MTKQKYQIPIVRIGYGFKTIEVEANSQEEAEVLALDAAGDHEYSEKSSEYEIEGRVQAKSSEELSSILSTIRNQILVSYRTTLDRLIQAYVDDVQAQNNSDAHIGVETEIEGYVDLKRTILFSEPFSGNEDGNLTEYIDQFHTNGEVVSVRAEGDNTNVKLDELNNGQLIQIITQMEQLIQKPNEIEIF